MSIERSKFVCRDCQNEMVKWVGRCSSCNSWNSFDEISYTKNESKEKLRQKSIPRNSPQKLSEIYIESCERLETGLSEIDRVLEGGITKGSITLIAGAPGVGKSTILMQIAGSLILKDTKKIILYTSGEESVSQVAARAKRLGITSENLFIYNQTSWQSMLEYIKKLKPKIFILDSIQTTTSQDIPSNAGSMSQIKEVIYEIMNYAKSCDLTCLVIGHITKNGVIAGPKTLEHMVDIVINFEGVNDSQNRLLRVIKNRYGKTSEVGFFKMEEFGLVPYQGTDEYKLNNVNTENNFGRSLTCIIEGSRCIYIEVQALVIENKFSQARKVSSGLDTNRLILLLAIVDKYFEIPLSLNDTYLNIIGGYKLNGRETDLCIIASLLSSFYSLRIPSNVVILGEVGLTGEVRCVPRLKRRLAELEQRNFKSVVLSERSAIENRDKFNINLIGVASACELKKILFKT